MHASDIPGVDYLAVSPYYKVFFKGSTVQVSVGDAWIQWAFADQGFGKMNAATLVADGNSLSISNVFDSVDLSYTVDASVLTEGLKIQQWKELDRVMQKISWYGMNPEYTEEGSILFSREGEKILEILPPFMRDAKGAVCNDVHYELIETEKGVELHKVIDEKGREWLKQAVYPVVIDPSMQTFKDAWESSGLTPYGQYFKNLKEYVNPANGFLTITQTDLVIPGRGLDLVISRVYQTPAIFYGEDPYIENPYEYEAPPVNVGKGWALDFPYIGSKYLHLWGGTLYRISWSGNTFENHTGDHFILVKNGDNTYTLTTADGMVCEFSTGGKLTSMRDIDQEIVFFTYTDSRLTSITDTIGRTVTLTYSNNRLWKITYNSCELEYSYDSFTCLLWMEDFLDRRTSYQYNTGFNRWLLSKITYPTTGYTTYVYDRFSDSDYYKYYVTDQRVYETSMVRHSAFSYTGTFQAITASVSTVKNESDSTKGSYHFTMNTDGLVTEQTIKNAQSTPIRKYGYAYNSTKAVTQANVYNDGSTLSYTTYYAYDNWGNVVYIKNAEGHESFFSYANTSTSGFFMDNTGTVIKIFTNAFSNSTVPSSVHTALIGVAEKQDATYVKEMYITYDSEAHPTQSKSSFGNATTYLTFSGTFDEKNGNTSFPIDLTGHAVAGNGVLQITGMPSVDTYTETHSYTPSYGPNCKDATWTTCGWQSCYYKTYYTYTCGQCPECDYYQGWASLLFTHYPNTPGYLSCSTNPACNQQAHTFTVTTTWNAYPAQVQYNLDNSSWQTVTPNVSNTTAKVTVPITDGQHTLYFSESSSQLTKFSWYLYVPVDNTPTTYTAGLGYDAYGNITSITDAESHTVTFTYSSSYSYAYLTEISASVGTETITYKATYDYSRGWITSIQQPKGVAAGSGYDTLYTYDLLGRVTKKELPLLPGQSQRSCLEAVYDDTARKVTIIDQLRHYITRHYDNLGRPIATKWYTGTYGSGTLYATESYTYRYDDLVSTVTDRGNDTCSYTYDFLGRRTQISYPDSSSVSYSYDDTNNKTTFTNERGYDRIYWCDWLSQLTKVEEEYATNTFAVTVYQYDEIGHLTSITDAENHTTTHTYGSLFGLTKTTYADSEYEEYAYDDAGNITSFTDCNGNETTYTYDSIYRLTQIQYQDQSTVSFTYDLDSNRTRMDDDAPNTGDYAEYVYDCWDRLTSETRHISQDYYTISYQYNVTNRITTLTYPDSMQILYSYDDLNRITEIRRYVDGSNDEILLDNVQYDTEGLLTQFNYGNDLLATFSYDSRDRISTIDVKNGETSFLDLEYTYDNTSNITQIFNGWRDTDSDWNSDTESYSYDGLDQLTSASCNSWSHTYSYDKAGNRTAKGSVTYTVNSVNEVTALSDGTTLTYDSNGNRTQKTKGPDTWDYAYDYADRLTKVEKNSTVLGEYIYDGEGRRVHVTIDSGTTTCMYGGRNILYEENVTGTAAYVYGPTGRLAKRTTINQISNTYYYHTDRLGSTRLVTDDSKNIVSAMTYHPYGSPDTEEGLERFLFTGKEEGSDDLYYYGARYYDPELGRFMTRDKKVGNPVDPRALNQYTYCLNNPVKYVDPDGRDPCGPGWLEKNTPSLSGLNENVDWILNLAYLENLEQSIGMYANAYEMTQGFADNLVMAGVGFLIGVLISAGFALFVSVAYILFEELVGPMYYQLWNDPAFRNLLNLLQKYAEMCIYDESYEDEFDETLILLLVEIAVQLYGEGWREKLPDLAKKYDDIMQKKEEEQGQEPGTGGGSGSSSGTAATGNDRGVRPD